MVRNRKRLLNGADLATTSPLPEEPDEVLGPRSSWDWIDPTCVFIPSDLHRNRFRIALH